MRPFIDGDGDFYLVRSVFNPTLKGIIEPAYSQKSLSGTSEMYGSIEKHTMVVNNDYCRLCYEQVATRVGEQHVFTALDVTIPQYNVTTHVYLVKIPRAVGEGHEPLA